MNKGIFIKISKNKLNLKKFKFNNKKTVKKISIMTNY